MWSKRLTPQQRKIVEEYWAKQPQPQAVSLKPLPTRRLWGAPYQWIIILGACVSLSGRFAPNWSFTIPFVAILTALLGWTVFRMVKGGSDPDNALAYGRSQLRAARCFLCGTCHYDLNGSPDEGKCPECGTQYKRAELVEAWRGAYVIAERYPLSDSDQTGDRR